MNEGVSTVWSYINRQNHHRKIKFEQCYISSDFYRLIGNEKSLYEIGPQKPHSWQKANRMEVCYDLQKIENDPEFKKIYIYILLLVKNQGALSMI